jgi:hypothetical protein
MSEAIALIAAHFLSDCFLENLNASHLGWKIAGLAATFSPVEKVQSLSPHHGFVMASRSPDGVFETGLPIALQSALAA